MFKIKKIIIFLFFMNAIFNMHSVMFNFDDKSGEFAPDPSKLTIDKEKILDNNLKNKYNLDFSNTNSEKNEEIKMGMFSDNSFFSNPTLLLDKFNAENSKSDNPDETFDKPNRIVQNNSRRREAEAYEAYVLSKESELTEEIKNCKRLEEQVKIRLKAIENSHDILTKTKNYKMLTDLQTQVEKKREIIEEKSLEVQRDWNFLGDKYASLDCTGDPVEVHTGRFMANYIDYKAQDYNQAFYVKRSFYNDNNTGSFGTNWICSLDSRIIRCNYDDKTELINCLLEKLDIVKKIKSNYEQFYNTYHRYNYDNKNSYDESVREEQEINNQLEYYRRCEDFRKLLLEKNKYVTYGKYSNWKNHYGFEDLLIYVDESGNEYLFEYQSGSNWELVNNELKNKIIIKGLDESGSYCNDYYCNGGYEVIFENGSKRVFTKYGILNKDIDNNKNITEYYEKDGVINKLKLKTGEIISITRNENNFITSIDGDISGISEYSYDGEKLKKIIFNDGKTNEYNYLQSGELSEIKKDNNSKIQILYEYNKLLAKNVCVKVINENGYEESFDLDVQNNIMKHNYYGEGLEIYNYDEYGRTSYYSDIYKNISKIQRNSAGQILTINVNGNNENYLYNDKNQVVQINYGLNRSKSYEYNEFGKIKNIKDQDNVNRTFEYDQFGNIIRESCEGNKIKDFVYYPNGLLKEVSKDNVKIFYKYNNFGSITEKNIILSDGQIFTTKWKYNEKNNLVEKIEPDGFKTTFEYYPNKDITKTNKYIKTRIFNSRGLIEKEITEELSSGKTYEKRNEYDNIGNITKVFINNNLYTEYEYYKIGILKSFTVWNMPEDLNKKEGIKTEYKYNENWQISNVIKSKVKDKKITESINIKEYKYSKTGNQIVILYKEYLKPAVKLTYDNYGNLIKKEWENGFYETFNYSASGKLIEKKDSDNNFYKIIYQNDGFYKIIYQNGNGGVISYLFNKNNMITKMKDYYGFIYTCEYNGLNQLVKETGPDYYIERKYDINERLTDYSLYNMNGELKNNYSVDFNDINNEEKTLVGGQLNSINKYDIWGRLTESNSIKGHFFYEYDCVGNCINIKDYYGNCSEFEYSPLGDVIIKILPDGTKEKYEYSIAGDLTSASCGDNYFININNYENNLEITNKGTLQNINYYNDNSIIEINNYDTGLLKRKKVDNKKVELIDDYNNRYIQIFNDNNQLLHEINPIGEQIFFEYGKDGLLKKFTDASGAFHEYIYDKENRKTIIKYNNKTAIEIKKNHLNKTVELCNDSYKLFYDYDNSGNLISIYSKLTDSLIEYKYDGFGRCIKKQGNNFIFNYEYDEMSRLSKVQDEKNGSFIKFYYDNLGRIKEKKLSNGNVEEYSYNDLGQIEYCIIKNNFGFIIYSNYILYDKYGRIALISDKDGFITKYKYDMAGKLISTEYPFTEELKEFYIREAKDCGFIIGDDSIKTEKLSLDNYELSELRKLYKKSGVISFLDVNTLQHSWIEKYDYDKNGNIEKVENPIGSIVYEHDKLNRIISKNYYNTNSFGIKVTWNKDNCIEKIENQEYRILFKYGNNKRPIEIKSENLINGDIKISEYIYDGIGRRVMEKNSGGSVEYIYDGFSTNLLTKQILVNDKYTSIVVNNNNDNNIIYKIDDLSDYKSKNDSRSIYDFEYVTDEEYRTYSRSKEKIESGKNKNEIESRSFSILSFGNCPLLISYIDGLYTLNSNCEFILTDTKNNFLGTTNINGEIENIIKADTWGNINSSESKINIWGLRNVDNQFSFIINLGYRDYIPLLKSFTTEDPERDGKNWFGYCCVDPINYKDINGYEKRSLSKAEQCYFRAEMMNYAAFNEEEYHKATAKGELYLGLHKSYDCADTSIAINVYIANKLGLSLKSQVAKDFDKLHSEKKYMDAKDTVSSASLINTPEIRRVCDGADYEFIKYANEVDENGKQKHEYNKEQYDKVLEDKALFEAILSNPDNISPGTVIAMKNSTVKRENTPERCGHTMTVVSVELNDDKTKVIGFSFLQGHTGGNKTELGYISLTPNATDSAISDFFGANAGLYEIEQNEGIRFDNNNSTYGESCVK